MVVLRPLLSKYFGVPIDATQHVSTSVLFECKNELGSGGGEALQECISMYCRLFCREEIDIEIHEISNVPATCSSWCARIR